MPRISSFYGIIIWMYWNDHNPPHFHATYNEFSIYAGFLPARALGLVIEWASLHQHELLENWRLMTEDKPLQKIQPLG